eukprot:TRINITY_DN35832_c0_g1_i5.p1 TRINITY_DN35832_c0_g1~~TRINITY_DN35832_c0_g1_i5.p1  ORF type:complete len:976 (+),score=150.42 TRINITY_DN35832_c0_g1_i5:313-3240(+)
MTSETVEFESGTEIDAEPSPQQQKKSRNKMRTSTEKKKKSGRRRRKCSCSSSIQGGLANVQHGLPTSRIPIFHRSLSLYSSSTAGFASLSTKQDHNDNSRRRIDKCQNQGSSTAQRRSTDDARVAACEFTRVWEEESSTLKKEEEAYASSSSSEEEEEEERVHPVRTATHPCFNSTNSISTCRIRSRSLSLSNKYRPKTFEDIIGHEINVKALSSAIHNDMVAPLYLFHGPSGTGKTSTATIFAMASNCESSASAAASASAWPCWSCRGCSTSIYINDLFCSPGSRGGGGQCGIERIKTLLLQSTALARTFKVKVFVIVEEEGCLAWDQLPSIVDNCHDDGSVVLVMVTGSNEGMGASRGAVPKAVSSRCQKFSFPKLKDTDVILKLAGIAAEEGIRIDSDALGLIAAKADGSMREAENILEQMSLLGSTITSSMVQQLVGLVPRSKLLSLLDAAMSSDAITTARRTRKLIALGVQPQALISQLAALITEILSGASVPLCKDKKKRPSRRRRIRSQRLCHALKILIETEKQLQSSRDHATRVVAALLEFASDSVSNITSTNIVLPKDIISADENIDISHGRNSTDVILKEQCDLVHHSGTTTHHFMNGLQELPSISAGNEADTSARRTDSADNCTAKMNDKHKWAPVSDMDEVWQNILGRIHSPYLKEFLLQQGKLVSLTVSRANAIVHILFKCREDKLALEMSEEAVSKALSEAFSCPVAVNISLQPTELEEMERVTVPKNEVADPSSSGQQTAPFLPLFKQPHNLGAAEIILKQRAGQTFASKLEHNLSQMRHLDSTQMFQGHEVNMAQRYQTPTFSGILTQGSRGDESIVQGKASIMKMPHHKACNISSTQLRHRWQSLSSIQQADASVEPYSQDLLFENVHTDGKQGTRRNPEKLCRVLSLATGCHHRGEPGLVLNRSWSCTDTICRDQKNMKMKVKVSKLVEMMNSSLLSLLKWRPRRNYSSVQGEGKRV